MIKDKIEQEIKNKILMVQKVMYIGLNLGKMLKNVY